MATCSPAVITARALDAAITSIVDRGSNHGVTVGAQFVVYRDEQRQPDTFLFELGEAVAVEVRPETSTLQVTVSRGAFIAGDYMALRP